MLGGKVAATFRKLQTDDGDFPHQHLMQKPARAVSFQVHILRNAVTTPGCWGRVLTEQRLLHWPDAWARWERGPPSVGANRWPCSACFTARCCTCRTGISFSQRGFVICFQPMRRRNGGKTRRWFRLRWASRRAGAAETPGALAGNWLMKSCLFDFSHACSLAVNTLTLHKLITLRQMVSCPKESCFCIPLSRENWKMHVRAVHMHTKIRVTLHRMCTP